MRVVLGMAIDVFKAPDMMKVVKKEENENYVPRRKKRRTAADFNMFCTWVLAYEAEQQELVRKGNSSPHDSAGSSTGSFSSDLLDSSSLSTSSSSSNLSNEDHEEGSGYVMNEHDDEAEDSFDLVTCYCSKPFSGRPMIECNECSTWIHLSCAKIRKSNIPDTFVCQQCRDSKHTIRRSGRVRGPKKRFIE